MELMCWCSGLFGAVFSKDSNIVVPLCCSALLLCMLGHAVLHQAALAKEVYWLTRLNHPNLVRCVP